MLGTFMFYMVVFRLVAFMIGACLASFINCSISRLKREEDWIFTPSHCDHCGHKLSWWENIPVFSCIFLHGTCRHCGKRFGYWHMLTEAGMGAYCMILYSLMNHPGLTFITFYGGAAVYSFVYITYLNAKYRNRRKKLTLVKSDELKSVKVGH